jgi:hypothetical protein
MAIFGVLGFIWTVLMGLRAPMLLWESRVMYKLFSTRYTRKQAAWVTFRYVFVPGLLLAPGVFVLEGMDTFKPALMEDMKNAAIHIDRVLQARA